MIERDFSFDSLLGFILIFLGILVLAYVLIHLLYWVFLTLLGIFFIVWGARLRKRAHILRWFYNKFTE